MAEIIIRKNRAGPQRYKFILREGHRAVIASRFYRSRASAVTAARTFIVIINKGVHFHE